MLDLLQSLLAFALTMLALATIVTLIMETIARLTRRRGRVFRHMLTLVFEKEIRTLLEDKLSNADIKRAIDTIQSSPFVPEKSEGWFRFAAEQLNRWLGANQSTSLTATEFLQRLSRTEVGTHLVETFEGAESELENGLKRIEVRYDEIAAASSEWVKNSSAILSLVIGIALAITWNIDGGRILNSYISNPDRAAAVTAKADEYIKANKAAERRLQTAFEEIDKAPEGEGGKVAKDALSDFQEQWKRIEKKGSALLAEGLPIGLDFYPHCRLPGFDIKERVDSRCMNEITGGDWLWILFVWLPIVTITGILIGLGGPFWYDAVLGLMRVTQLLRGVSPAPPAEAPPGGGAGETPEKKMADQFRDRHQEADDADQIPLEIKANADLRQKQLNGLARRIRKKTGKSPPACRKGIVLATLNVFQSKPKGAGDLLKQYEIACEEWKQTKALEANYRAASNSQQN